MFTFKNSTRGFTLIELLVVITIIGILATGATATYTSQIQKARDTTRIGDMQALQSGIEQYYQDKTEYPDASNLPAAASPFSGVITYIPKLPTDPKTKQICNKGTAALATACDYLYTVSTDANGILNGEYKISTGFENQGNIDTKAFKDGGVEVNRFEMGLNLANGKSTLCDRTAQATFAGTLIALDTSTCKVALGTALLIAGNP